MVPSSITDTSLPFISSCICLCSSDLMNGIKSRMCWLLDRLKANSSNSSQKLLIFCCGIPALKNIQTTSTGYTWVLSDNVSPFGWSCLLYLCEASTMCHAFLPSGDPLMIYVSLIGHDSWPRSFSLKVALCTLCRTVCLQTHKDYHQQTPSHDLGETLISAWYKQSHLSNFSDQRTVDSLTRSFF